MWLVLSACGRLCLVPAQSSLEAHVDPEPLHVLVIISGPASHPSIGCRTQEPLHQLRHSARQQQQRYSASPHLRFLYNLKKRHVLTI